MTGDRADPGPGESRETTGSGMRLPDFFVIGAAKSGTSSLARALSFHPRIFMSPVKEPEFFSHDENFAAGLASYAALFARARADQLCAEASTAYTRFPQYPRAAERMARHLPRAKLVYLLRHPVERAHSHYMHRYTKELYPDQPITASFEQHVARDPMCLDGSDYKLQIEQYLRFFPRESMLLLFTEDFKRDPADLMRQVCRFLQIDEHFVFPPAAFEPENVGAVYKDIVVRRRIASTVKSLPGVEAISGLLPEDWNSRIYALIRRSPLGRRVDREMEARPMSAATRQQLLARYAETTRFVEGLAGRELRSWRV